MNQTVILASQSQARADLLRRAGVSITSAPAHIDEAAIKQKLVKENTPPADIAMALATAKAQRVCRGFPDQTILAGDQVLVFNGEIFDKPTSLNEAKHQLLALRGQSHTLISAAVIFQQSQPVWQHVSQVELSMRPFSDGFLHSYLATTGDDLFTTVGGYKLESLGSQLFSSVKGDYFSVLGLPLLEVLEFLRGIGICQS